MLELGKPFPATKLEEKIVCVSLCVQGMLGIIMKNMLNCNWNNEVYSFSPYGPTLCLRLMGLEGRH